MSERPGLLGMRPSRHFKVFREEFPAIFRFNGKLYQEDYNIDEDTHRWIEISEEYAERWLAAKNDSQFETVVHETGVFTLNHGPIEKFEYPVGCHQKQIEAGINPVGICPVTPCCHERRRNG